MRIDGKESQIGEPLVLCGPPEFRTRPLKP
jgi:hypothetical protein